MKHLIPAPSPEDTLPDKAGSTHRLEALSDGMFAVALTLLILDIKVPEVDLAKSDLTSVLRAQLPQILIYALSEGIQGEQHVAGADARQITHAGTCRPARV